MKSANIVQKYVAITRPISLRDYGWFSTKDIADIICEAYPKLSHASQRRLVQIAIANLKLYNFDLDDDEPYCNGDFEPTLQRVANGKSGQQIPTYSKHASRAILETMKFEVINNV